MGLQKKGLCRLLVMIPDRWKKLLARKPGGMSAYVRGLIETDLSKTNKRIKPITESRGRPPG